MEEYRNFFTYKKTRFILQILYRNASMYLHYLRILDKKSEVMEQKLHGSPKNQEIIELLEMQKSLVYFHHLPPGERGGAGEASEGGQH